MEQNMYRKNSFMAGILYLFGTIFGILSAVIGGDVMSSLVNGTSLDGTSILTLVSSETNGVITGAFFILLMGISLVAMTLFLYPIFRKDNQELALGMVLFRGALEGTWYFITTLAFLGLAVVGIEAGVMGADTTTLETLAKVLYNFQDLIGPVGTIMFVIGASCLYISFFRTKLIPRWLSLWGLIGVAPYLLYALLHLFGLDNGIGFYLQMPLALQEMVMAFWLIVKGFDKVAVNYLISK
jgi:hypothetical protein